MAGPLQLLQFGVELETLSVVELVAFWVPEVLGSSAGGSESLCVQHWPENSLHILSTTSLTTWSLNCKEDWEQFCRGLDQIQQKVICLLWDTSFSYFLKRDFTIICKNSKQNYIFIIQYPVHVGFEPRWYCFLLGFHPFVYFGHSLFKKKQQKQVFLIWNDLSLQ